MTTDTRSRYGFLFAGLFAVAAYGFQGFNSLPGAVTPGQQAVAIVDASASLPKPRAVLTGAAKGWLPDDWQYGVLDANGRISYVVDWSTKYKDILDREENARLLTAAERANCGERPNECIGVVLGRRYDEVSKELVNRLADRRAFIKGLVSVLNQHEYLPEVDPSKTDLPTREFNRSIPIARLQKLPSDDQTLKACRNKATYRGTNSWSLSGVPFLSGNVLMTPYFDELPLHGMDEPKTGKEAVVFDEYRGRRKVYSATLMRTQRGVELTVSHPLTATPGRDSSGKAEYVISGYGLLQDDVVEVLALRPPLMAQLVPGTSGEEELPPPSTLDVETVEFSKYLSSAKEKLRALDRRIAASAALGAK